MGSFNQQAFNDFIINNDVIGFFEKPITLKSGRQSNWYVNWRTIASDVYRLDQLTDFIVAFTQTKLLERKLCKTPECFYGVPEGATKYAVLTQYKWAKQQSNYGPGSHVLAMGRSKPKEHGVPSDRFFIGAPAGATLVIEDTTTTGGSLLETLDKLIAADIEVIAAIGLTNRMERRDDGLSVAEAIAAKQSRGRSISYLNLSSATALLPQAFKRLQPSLAIARAVEAEFREVGIEPLVLE